jgi:ribosomal protein S18 acetylase RimI-like enzyme/predicted transcriptional regulator
MLALKLMRPTANDPALRAVIELAKKARQTVGFLPDLAFAQRAVQGTVLTAMVGGEVVGYALYDLPRDEIRLVQLVVADQHRGHGIARMLVDAIAREHEERRGILLHCRNDFPAHRAWDKLDFLPVGERPGRSVDGKPLTRWFRPFGRPDLFSYLRESDTRSLATMDACVFFDLVAPRPKAVAEQLRADWLGEHVRLGVTDQLLVEIRDGNDADERRRQRVAADPLRLSPTPRKAWESHYEHLLAEHPDAPEKHRSDLKHVAQSVALGAAWLITSDRPLARRYGNTAKQLGVRLVTPQAFVREIDEQARGDRYRPIDLADTDVTRREVDARVLPALADTFVDHRGGERLRDLRAQIDLAAASAGEQRLEVIEVDQEPRGLVSWRVSPDSLDVMLIRATTGRGETTIGRHLLALVRDQAIATAVETIRIVDAHAPAIVQRSFRDEGFAAAGDAVVAHALRGRGTLANLRRRAGALGSPLAQGDALGDDPENLIARAAAAERWFAPFRVLGAGIPTFVVPIRHGWATRLIGAGLPQDQLWSREWGLGLRRELVYYRSTRNSGGLAAPSRLLWYVSGSAQGAGTIRATSHLTEVAADDADRLYHRFRPLGVYNRSDVRGCADRRGHAMALRFSHTETFEKPVPLDEYRRVDAGDPKAKQVVLQSARAISEHTFVALLNLASPDER